MATRGSVHRRRRDHRALMLVANRDARTRKFRAEVRGSTLRAPPFFSFVEADGFISRGFAASKRQCSAVDPASSRRRRSAISPERRLGIATGSLRLESVTSRKLPGRPRCHLDGAALLKSRMLDSALKESK